MITAWFRRLLMYRLTAHCAFWGAFVALMMMQQGEEIVQKPWLLVENLLFLASLAVPMYLNLLVLVPRFFHTHRMVAYLGWLTALLVATALVLTYGAGPFIHVFARTGFAQNLTNLFFFAALTTPIKLYRDSIRKQLDVRELQAKQYKAELDLLRAQVNPHFLFNTLNNLYALTLEKSDAAPDVVLRLSAMMRYLLESSRAERVPLHQEIEFLRNYFALEGIRLKSSADVHFEVQGEAGLQPIAPMLLIPFVENAFKHGVNRATSGAFVHALLRVEAGELLFFVENNHPNEALPAPVSTRTGLYNVQRRLELLYPGSHTLEISAENHTFSIQLQLCPFPA